MGRARPLAARCPGRAPARPLASAPSALPPGALSCGARCPGAARGGRDRGRGVPGQAGGGPAAPAAASRCRVFFGKLRLFLPLSGLRPRGADESVTRGAHRPHFGESEKGGLQLGAVVGDRRGT